MQIIKARMEEYLLAWWNGELVTNGYELWGWSITNWNRFYKLLMYLYGLLAIFEILQFTQIVKQVKVFAIVYTVFRSILNSYFLIPWLLIRVFNETIIYFQTKKNHGKTNGYLNEISFNIRQDFFNEMSDRFQDAKDSWCVRILQWFQSNPINTKLGKMLGYIFFVIASLGELITS